MQALSSVRDQVLAAAWWYAFRCAADALPLAPGYARFVRQIARAYAIPAAAFDLNVFVGCAYRVVDAVERAFLFACYSVFNPRLSIPRFAFTDSPFVRALARALDHADIFSRVASLLPAQPYSSETRVSFLQAHVCLVTRSSARNVFTDGPVLPSDDPLLSRPFASGYFTPRGDDGAEA